VFFKIIFGVSYLLRQKVIYDIFVVKQAVTLKMF